MSAQAADANSYQYVLAACAIVQAYAKQWMRVKSGMRNGNAPVTAFPVMPAFPTAVAPVAWGVETRFRALRQDILTDPAATDAILTGLGLEGAERTAPDLSTIAPVLTLKLRGLAVYVDWVGKAWAIIST